ncbi:uncharacterized protein LOC143279557 [Babylonia areolata]|uniref:uncharacterized protein LOC143279557 n=1 Tax=Babylonia areolata TaxID=304850 RepID=UPI003FD54CAD
MTTPPVVSGGGEESTTTTTTPGLQLHLVDSDDEPLDEGVGGPRRPSTASLSRFRSCPQLSSADTHTQDSPESEEYGLGAELCVGSVHFTQGSPRIAPRRQKDGGDAPDRAQSPSSSDSDQNHDGIKPTGESSRARGKRSMDTAAAAVLPRAVGRSRLDHIGLGRTTSIDSPFNEAAVRFFEDSHHPRSEELGSERGSRPLSQFFEEPPELSLDGRLTVTEDGTSVLLGGGERTGSYHPDQDSIDKCARWLQSLKMTSGDRLKSRSHVQLPPI